MPEYYEIKIKGHAGDAARPARSNSECRIDHEAVAQMKTGPAKPPQPGTPVAAAHPTSVDPKFRVRGCSGRITAK